MCISDTNNNGGQRDAHFLTGNTAIILSYLKKKKKTEKRAHPEDSEPVDLVTFSKDLNINIHNFI